MSCGPRPKRSRFELAADLSPMYMGVLVDRDMLMQAAINLLSNADQIHARRRQRDAPQPLADHEANFRSAGHRRGPERGRLVRVFEKFYRVKKDSEMAPGTGLGLPLAKHIVEDVHGGQLTSRANWAKAARSA